MTEYDNKRQQLVKALAKFVTNGDNDSLQWSFEINKKYDAGLFNNKEYITSIVEAFARNGFDEKILPTILKIIPRNEREILTRKFVTLIESKDPNKYNPLLKAIKNKEIKWPEDVLETIRSEFLKISVEANVQSFQILDAVVDTYYGSNYDELKEMANRAEVFLSSAEQAIQNHGFSLLKKINAKKDSGSEQFGVPYCLSTAKELLKNNDIKAQPFLNFVLEYIDKIGYNKDDLIQIIREQINSSKPIPLLTFILDSILKLDKYVQSKFFDELLELTKSTQDGGIKEKCRQIFLSADLLSRQKRKVKEIFGEEVFGKN